MSSEARRRHECLVFESVGDARCTFTLPLCMRCIVLDELGCQSISEILDETRAPCEGCGVDDGYYDEDDYD